ncbi:MAG: maltose alpha-D-glucosyltransferase [Planctomycetes bacterium GWF2_41_51]|nr:MAG: maltose alpha-D-glucosyltransferase [Planctomycetes bacterium GWF2_41_51]HBG26878.1 maltose alpha-D-glucosyltransferase [Phycisphaerales bacterium]
MISRQVQLADDPLWYKDAIIYQLHVRSFFDSNNDGIGDFQGLAQKLDYLEDLGVNVVWLLPFYPSPLKDDGYDIASYSGIHPFYGTMEDFTKFLKKAHYRGIRVITELVINHTSDNHPWFQLARRSPKGSKLRNYYVWSDTPEKYKGVRIIFKDFETSNWTYDAIAESYYWHRFYSHQPDLNYESKDVRKAVLRFLDMWMDKGVDGLRLDAIPYLYEQEGTSCENLPQTHTFLKQLRAHIDKNYSNRVLLAEANQWPEQVVPYFGDDDECHMALHFPIMPRLFMAIRMENHFPIVDILNQTPAIPKNSQWAMFLRNHDELTLEMVTDRDRDYMYQVYARDRAMRINLGIRRRLAPLLENDRKQIELMNCLLFSMPGTPIIYYGDEIGMGDNIFLGDRNGIRTPMQWSADRNAGFSKANPQQLFLPITLDPQYHYEAVNVQNQQSNQNSLLWWMKHLINLRKRFKAFGRGSIKFLNVKNPKILAFLREYDNEKILILANLAGSVQYVQLEIPEYKGMTPLELFGQTELPCITESPYLFTLGAYGFYWFQLYEKPAEVIQTIPQRSLPTFRLEGYWENLIKDKNKQRLERIIFDYIKYCGWFRGKGIGVERLEIIESFRIPDNKDIFHIVLFEIEYSNSVIERYILPAGYTSSHANLPEAAVIAKLTSTKNLEGFIYDAIYSDTFLLSFLNFTANKRDQRGIKGRLITSALKRFPTNDILHISVENREEEQVTVTFGQKYSMKIYRWLEPGISPELEISDYLTSKKFAHIMQVRSSLQYSVFNEENTALGIIYDYVPNQGSIWQYTLNYLMKNYEAAGKQIANFQKIPSEPGYFFDILNAQPPVFVQEFFQLYSEQMQLLAQRTAKLHTILSMSDEQAFKPEPFTDFHKYSQYQSVYSLIRETIRLLDNRLSQLPPDIREQGRIIMHSEKDIISRFKAIRDRHISAMRIRIHGNYNLGKILYTGKDFIITGFEGQYGHSLSERRNKMSPLRDAANMLRSIHYASFFSTFNIPRSGFPLAVEQIVPVQNLWYLWTCAAFVSSYLNHSKDMPFMPKDSEELKELLRCYLLERTFIELQNELKNRPEWARVPFEGILQIIRKTK